MRSTIPLLLPVLLLLPASTRAQEEPSGTWVTTARVNVRCPDGEIIAVLDRGENVQVLGRGDEGWYKVEFEGETPCTEHYIALRYLRPASDSDAGASGLTELTFWNLHPGARRGIDVDGVHFPGGSAFQLLHADSGTDALTIIGPRGSPVTVQSVIGVRNDYFINLKWDSARNSLSCATLDSSSLWVKYFRGFSGLVATPAGALLIVALLIALHILSAIGHKGFTGQWGLTLFLEAVVLFMTFIAHSGYENGKSRCEAAGTFLKSRLTPEGYFLPIEDARYIQSPGEPAALDQEEYAGEFSSAAFAFLLIQPFYLLLLVRAFKGLHYLLVPHPVEKLLDAKAPTDPVPVEEAAVVIEEGMGESPREVYVEENQARRVRAQTERFRAERDLLDVLVDRERSRTKLKETKGE